MRGSSAFLEGHEGQTQLENIASDIKEEQNVLRNLIETVGSSESVIRRTGGWFAEKAAAIKLFVDDPSGGAFRTFEALEALSIGIEGKRLMWRVIDKAAASEPALAVADFKELISKAKNQRKRVEKLRRQFALESLTKVNGTSPKERPENETR